MRIKTVRKKGKRIVEKGLALPHNKVSKKGAKNIREIRGIYKMYLKAPIFLLKLAGEVSNSLFITSKGELTPDKSKAVQYRYGYDDPERKRTYWQEKTKVKLIILSI
jgi:hypothetical protein